MIVINIFILDDNTNILENTERIIQECAKKLALTDYKVTTFSQGLSLLNALDILYIYGGLYILDIDLQEEKQEGIRISQIIKEKDQDAILVFHSSHPSYMKLAITSKTGAYTFISKAEEENSIKDQFLDAVKFSYDKFLEDNGPGAIGVTIDRRSLEIDIDDIIFFEHFEKRVYLYLREGEPLSFVSSFTKLETQLPNFIRTNRSYLVNPRNITDFDQDQRELTFVNGDVCSVSKTNVTKVVDWLSEHKEYFNYFS